MRLPHVFPFHRLVLAAAAAVALLSDAIVQAAGPAGNAHSGAATVADRAQDPERTPVALTLEKIGGLEGGVLGASEINAYDSATRRLFVTNGANGTNGTVDVLDMSNPAEPRVVATLEISDLGTGANSVAVHRGLVALAIQASPKTAPGKVAFYRASDLAGLAVGTVGVQPHDLPWRIPGHGAAKLQPAWFQEHPRPTRADLGP